jgi:hypothetical protein
MIEDAIKPLEEALKDAFRPGDAIALESANGMVICAEQGGPAISGQPYNLTGRPDVNVWETWIIKKGVR